MCQSVDCACIPTGFVWVATRARMSQQHNPPFAAAGWTTMLMLACTTARKTRMLLLKQESYCNVRHLQQCCSFIASGKH